MPYRGGLVMVTGILLVAGAILGLASTAAASSLLPTLPAGQGNEACLACHNQVGMTRPMPSGETLVLTVDPQHYDASVHRDILCTDCHTTITTFPHPELTAESLREITIEMYTSCQQCHSEQFRRTLDSVHQQALAGGNLNAAVCADCHNPHTQTAILDDEGNILPEARLHIPQTCAHCHSAIYGQYAESVHGAALTAENNPDVPTCIDCHGVHDIEDPRTAAFRLSSPQICAECHTDADIMDQYGISTDVLNTYVADFHGTTVTLFEQRSPDQATNKPVCYDCHGIHDITPTDDPVHGISIRDNLLTTCQRCHPDATANFPSSWMSHYIPSQENYPIVYYVNLFYKIFIPAVLGPMILYVLTDVARRMIERRKGAKHA